MDFNENAILFKKLRGLWLSNELVIKLEKLCSKNDIINNFMEEFLDMHFKDLKIPKTYMGDIEFYKLENKRWMISKLVECVRYEQELDIFVFNQQIYLLPKHIKNEIYKLLIIK